MPGLMHWVSVQKAAGVEAHFAEFVEHTVRRYPEWKHVWLNPQRTVHPYLAERLQQSLAKTVAAKYRWGVKLPGTPEWIRSWHCRRESIATGATTGLIWNRAAQTNFLLNAIGAENCIHWEHGSIWHPGREQDRARYLKNIPLAITNSRASARVLQLMWNFTGEIQVCLNALRPSLMPEEPQQKRYPSDRRVRLGVAARLVPVKGVPLVLHAMRILAVGPADFELHVAGAGLELDRLQQLAKQLKISQQCHFLGAVQDMRRFYEHVDCLVHPPLTEAFGLVAIEAAAHGCPAIVAEVDGLPEATKHGVGGLCVSPTVSLDEYPALDGEILGIPEQVYDPVNDELCEPKFVDPAVLAKTIQDLFADRDKYERLSATASQHVIANCQFDKHVDAVMGVINRFVRRAV